MRIFLKASTGCLLFSYWRLRVDPTIFKGPNGRKGHFLGTISYAVLICIIWKIFKFRNFFVWIGFGRRFEAHQGQNFWFFRFGKGQNGQNWLRMSWVQLPSWPKKNILKCFQMNGNGLSVHPYGPEVFAHLLFSGSPTFDVWGGWKCIHGWPIPGEDFQKTLFFSIIFKFRACYRSLDSRLGGQQVPPCTNETLRCVRIEIFLFFYI